MALGDDGARRQGLLRYLNATTAMVRSEQPDLTLRQLTVLLKVYLDDDDQTVRGLASFAQISKPAITRALDRLAEFDLIRRRIDPQDRRSVIVQRTQDGRLFLRKFGDVVITTSDRDIAPP
jgi:DNA-binding MarR family transcriptional regulator